MDRLRYQPPLPLANEIFRAYDIRGIVDKPVSYTHLTLPTIYSV